jgi:hypothetical protein
MPAIEGLKRAIEAHYDVTKALILAARVDGPRRAVAKQAATGRWTVRR